MSSNDLVQNVPNTSSANQNFAADQQAQQQQAGLDFIRQIVTDDVKAGRTDCVVTRFPPEPNGYLHIGHVKAICLNFSIAEEFGGKCNLRFDDTNPDAEEQEFVDGIQSDIEWLGFHWDGQPRYASSYFDQLYLWAVKLIKQGDAYVDLQTPEEIKLNRGSFVEVGKNSPYRDATVEENLSRFEQMKNDVMGEGKAVLRAKIDMTSPNVHLRDPILYRVLDNEHHQTGAHWKIYPMYDYAHPLSDAIEGVTHSLCTLEFVDHRPFYDWIVEKVHSEAVPRQYESSRLNVSYTITSKRKLRRLVEGNFVKGWDDPRMPTVVGMRRRGFTADGLRDFCKRVGVSKTDGIVDVAMLEFCIRQSLENTASRAMAVLNPLKVTLTNLPESMILTQKRHPNVDMGERDIPLTDVIYIDRKDFEEVPPKGFKRLIPDGEVRLRHAYVIKCDEVVQDANGEVIELKCSVDVDTLGKNPEGRKVKGVIHWVSAEKGVPAEVRIYDRLFSSEDPEEGEDFLDNLNPDSLQIVQAVIEPSLAQASPEDRFQFEREGYFVADRYDHTAEKPVFNRILDLRDSFKPEK
ncbi:glutamine--tRNA ligase/YqeY domain fusion protein [Acinetobacter sp. A3.8]|uniref:Glutamine--tRNA ligase n=1 Tax=Acinetobacter sedimenti TaxID=2919922 RepID=A0A9X1WWS7_9GAMM|nr:glutamine--tRNA ligase/YqeY domain fusion protein [Acinetobacter sedimenti]MCJ8146431.1 glutamine--tRNA ligase/YqeY domain fusion protein [Acinetobacter sedimenti]